MIVTLARIILPERSLKYLDRRWRYGRHEPKHKLKNQKKTG